MVLQFAPCLYYFHILLCFSLPLKPRPIIIPTLASGLGIYIVVTWVDFQLFWHLDRFEKQSIQQVYITRCVTSVYHSGGGFRALLTVIWYIALRCMCISHVIWNILEYIGTILNWTWCLNLSFPRGKLWFIWPAKQLKTIRSKSGNWFLESTCLIIFTGLSIQID